MLDSYMAYSSTLKMEATLPPKRQFAFNGLHGVITQKIELFITTGVRTSTTTRSAPIYVNAAGIVYLPTDTLAYKLEHSRLVF
jgi:hypothetical protein